MEKLDERAKEALRDRKVDNSERDFHIVFVPADEKVLVTNQLIHQAEGKGLSCLTDHCREHFRKVGLNESQKAQLKEQLQAGVDQPIDHKILSAFVNESSMAEATPLQPATKSNGHIGVFMYSDDHGTLKNLPVNRRATAICKSCNVDLQVRGDVFIGRNYDDEEAFLRLDFTTGDLDSNSEWMRKMATAREGARRNAISGKALDLKDKGNRLFQTGQFQEAVEKYTEAFAELGVDSVNSRKVRDGSLSSNSIVHALFSNRSACHYQLKMFDKALEDAIACTSVRPDWAKGYGRLAEALVSLQRPGEALSALQKGIELCTENETKIRAELNQKAENLKKAQINE